jgi:hypothetical protein
VWPLTTPALGWHTLDLVSGLGAVPITITSDPYARGGVIIRHTQPQPRYLTWPLRVRGTDHSDFLTLWRPLMLAFTQTRYLGPGILTIARPDGSARQIQAVYQSGFDGTPGDLSGWQYDTAVLTLLCPDPYWTSIDETIVDRAYAGSAADFFDPYPTISSADTLGDTTVTNPGDAPAWPTWTINGPASGIAATNNLTGESFTLDPDATGIGHGNLLLGETITISTNPPAVRGPDGSIWTAALDWPDAVLWPLYPGDNPVTFTVSGSGAGTSIALAFHNRYESA